MRLPTRLALIGLLLLVAVGGSLSLFGNPTGQPSEPTPVLVNYSEGECIEQGVTIVVDFGSSSSANNLVRCAIRFEGNGWQVLEATDLHAEGTAQYPIGFVCRLASFPEETTQDCLDTPRYAEGSWGYFIYNGTWRVSGVGSVSRQLSCGAIEGWRFIEAGEDLAKTLPRFSPSEINCD